MLETRGDLWQFHRENHWVGVTTNSVVKQSGRLVMGAGIAAQARDRFPKLDLELGKLVWDKGNHVYPFYQYKVFSFPTKYHWRNPSYIGLILRSCEELIHVIDTIPIHNGDKFYLPRPGCGNGGLNWEDEVRPLISNILDDRVVIVTR